MVLEVVEVNWTIRLLEHLRINDETLVNLTSGLRFCRLLLVVCHVLADPSLILLIQPHLVVGDPVLLVVCPLLLVLLLLLVLISAIGFGSVCDLLLLILVTIVELHAFLEECMGSVLSGLGHGSLLE